MGKRRIKSGDILVGKPLSWDVFNDKGELLLKKDAVIATEFQLKTLVREGLYFYTAQKQSGRAENPIVVKRSPFEIIDDVYLQLSDIFKNTETNTKLPSRIIKLCAMLQAASEQDPNASLGIIFFNSDCRYSVIHSIETALISKTILDSLGVYPEDQLTPLAAALTMNITMIDLQEKLFSQKEPLTHEQKRQIREHPERAVSCLEKCGVSDRVWLDAVSQHHEYLNGKGYPKGLKGPEISMTARILSVVDTYCAKISNRSYRGPILPTMALRDLFVRKDNSLDAIISQILIKKLGMYPPGLFVELRNGEIAVVTHVGTDVRYPRLHSVVDAKGRRMTRPVIRDCTEEEYVIKKGITKAEARVEVNRFQLWGYM
jgi:hypothetical protein